ncbi:ATP-dependent RNA helicase DDX19/DBP5 [Nematocida homosporus]|uniref:ATP-dependent RNA helicase DDX19/DBP5 n=1 Tax=Nematocida homosporus TaxID=1912981 RepID=UPI00221FB36A|nr:ATP-dependent RNA helicase DDX19/DBP5 [Nematocida homosporus]KAI5187447.1 ATP-dependent RNA helicase DDX19/DBP5 [Nematocida homosporus]
MDTSTSNIKSDLVNQEPTNQKKEKEEEEISPDVQAAIEMLKQMEISKKENESLEEYKKSLLSSELLSKSTFEEISISEVIIKALRAQGFKTPSSIQAKSIPEIATGKDVAFQSHSGSGKTIAFIVGALNKLDLSDKSSQVVIVAPTRDLSRQIYAVLETFKPIVQFTSFLAVAGQIDSSTKVEGQIIVGSPGSTKSVVLRHIDPKKIKMVILDEADAMLADETGQVITMMLNRIPQKQLVLFSATFSEHMKSIINKHCRNGIKTFYSERANVKPDNITQFYIETTESKKTSTLLELFGMVSSGQVIVFTAKRDRAEEICRDLGEDGFDSTVLHGQLSVEQRDKAIAEFKDGSIKVLITTNVLSRGIDVPQLNLAINYDVPRTMTGSPDIETYIHRIGRTGRFNRAGVSVTFISGERDLKDLVAIEKAVNGKIQYITMDAMKEAIARKAKETILDTPTETTAIPTADPTADK